MYPSPLRAELAQLRQEFGRTDRAYRRLGQKRDGLQREILAIVEKLNH
jgi:vacuolar-type H+-ATPase subunit D/Vma8